MIRDPAQTAAVEKTGARAVVEDIQGLDVEGWERLLAGKDVVIWSAGAGGGDPERTRAIDRDAAIAAVDAARRVGVRRLVMVSYFGAGPDHGVPEDNPFHAYAQAKTEADAHLQDVAGHGDIEVVILRPSALTLDAPTGRVDTGAAQASEVPRGDVARVIAAAVDQEGIGARGATIIAFNRGDQPIGEAVAGFAAEG